MFIRTRDDIKIISGDNNPISYISFVDSDDIKRSNRKWNIVKKFRINKNELDFFDDELTCKMIPKQHKIFSSIDIKLIMTSDSNLLIFQEFAEYPCKFLTIDDDSGFINTIDFFDIQLDKTEILCYDFTTSDYYLTGVQSAILLTADQHEEEHHSEQLYLQHLNSLSKYMLYCEQHTGFVVNNILIF
jgi:hypothetical protein